MPLGLIRNGRQPPTPRPAVYPRLSAPLGRAWATKVWTWCSGASSQSPWGTMDTTTEEESWFRAKQPHLSSALPSN